MTRLNAFFALLFLVALISCADSTSNQDQTGSPAEQEVPTKPKFNSGMADPSELTLVMRGMEMHMQALKTDLENEQLISADRQLDFSGIHTVRASNHVIRDESYTQLGNSFLEDYQRLFEQQTVAEQKQVFTQSVKACVTCHASYCPGPVMRIKKLNL